MALFTTDDRIGWMLDGIVRARVVSGKEEERMRAWRVEDVKPEKTPH